MRSAGQDPTIALPDPSLVLLIGVTGAGKSTFAARHFRPTQVLASDAFRSLVADDETDQTATAVSAVGHESSSYDSTPSAALALTKSAKS